MDSRRGQRCIIAALTRRRISRLDYIYVSENLLVTGMLLKMSLDFE